MENTYSFIDHTPRPGARFDAELLDSYSRTITGVVAQVAEAVVHIQVQKPAEEGYARGQQPGQQRQPGQGRQPENRRLPEQGRQPEQNLVPASGSGFIISTDGFVVTNNHVIEQAREIRVSLADGRIVSAELKGGGPIHGYRHTEDRRDGAESAFFCRFRGLTTRTDRHCDRKSTRFAAYRDRRGGQRPWTDPSRQ